MWNKKLQNFDDQNLLYFIKDNYDFSPEMTTLVNHGINIVYKIVQNKEHFFLKVSHNSIRSCDELNKGLCFQEHLKKSNILVPEIIKNRRGQNVTLYKQNNEKFLLHIIKEVSGRTVKMGSLTDEDYFLWGETLSKVHTTGRGLKLNLRTFDDFLIEYDIYAEKSSDDIKTVYFDVTSKIKNFPLDENNYGIIHGDHRDENVLYDEKLKKFSFIDFDEPLSRWFLFDIIRPFLDAYISGDQEILSKLKIFIKGYLKNQPNILINDEMIHLALKLKVLVIYLWTMNNWESPLSPNGLTINEWMEPLKNILIFEVKRNF